MPNRFLDTMTEAILEIAETMLFVEIGQGEPQMTKSTLPGDMSSVIGYSGALKGSLRLGGQTPAVLKLAGALLGEERDEVDKEMEDAFSEMANMVAGGVQTRLLDSFGDIRMSPPVIISGPNHEVTSDRSFDCVSKDFQLDGETFFIEIYYSHDSLPTGAPGEGEDDSDAAFGFSLMGQGDDESGETPAPAAPAEVSEQQVLAAVEGALGDRLDGAGEQFQEMGREIAREMIRELLPEIAERVVREEIEKIKGGAA